MDALKEELSSLRLKVDNMDKTNATSITNNTTNNITIANVNILESFQIRLGTPNFMPDSKFK